MLFLFKFRTWQMENEFAFDVNSDKVTVLTQHLSSSSNRGRQIIKNLF